LNFPTSYSDILDRVDSIRPLDYGKTRNYIDGAVSYLSPYISRGVISTKQVYEKTLSLDLPWAAIEKFIQELAWRDYWQQIWIEKGNLIDQDLKQQQSRVAHRAIPSSLVKGETGIDAIDAGIQRLYENGYMHNHLRMYVAAIACNIARSHWKIPAQWMYYHLLDGDWASNALSWQWVAGSNSKKKYFANQENINRYCKSEQKQTFLDVPYEAFDKLPVPKVLSETVSLNLNTQLPEQRKIRLDPTIPTFVYNYYNLDPYWRKDERGNRIFLLEPTFFNKYPMSERCMQFALHLFENIAGGQVFVGSYEEFLTSFALNENKLYFKEHPSTSHYRGNKDERDWMFSVKGYYPSFFAFWKRCKKEIGYEEKG